MAGACVDKGPGPTQKEIDPAYIDKNLLSAPPEKMTHAIHADIGGKVVYLGNDMASDTAVVGQPFQIVHYWKVVEPPGADWRVFAHLEGASKRDWMNVDRTDMRLGYGPARWKAGDIIRDEQEIRVGKGWSSSQARLLMGLYRKGGQTAADRLPVVSGPADDQSRVLVATIEVARSAKPAVPKPGYVVLEARQPIVVDGRADEDDWKRAPQSPAFTTAEGSPEVRGAARARLLWDDDHLYVFLQARDPDVFSQFVKHDEPLWKEDVVEIFIDADENQRGYVELQVNPNNAQFDAWFATDRSGKTDVEWNAAMTSAIAVHGSADNRDDDDTGWDVEIAIPLAAVKGGDPAMRVAVPPKPGDTWRLNVVRIDKPKDDKRLAVDSWNPITYRDFHALDRMLVVVFGDQTGNTQPKPATPPSPQPEGATPEGATPEGAAPKGTTPEGATLKGATPGGATPKNPAPDTPPAGKGPAGKGPAGKAPAGKAPAGKAGWPRKPSQPGATGSAGEARSPAPAGKPASPPAGSRSEGDPAGNP